MVLHRIVNRPIRSILPLFLMLIAGFCLLGLGVFWSAKTTFQSEHQARSAAGQSSTQPSTSGINPATSAAATAAAQKSTQPATGAKITTVSSVPACTIGTSAKPTAVPLGVDQSGLIKAPQQTGTYTIFGTTVSQISNQMFSCSPVVEGDSHFAASTDYVISWNFGIRTTTGDLCELTNVRVGLAISQTYPSWQPTAGTTAATAASWQQFMTNLQTHENGHAALDTQYAQQLLNNLQRLPATSCETIGAIANAQAQNDIAALNRANESYDATTNHGTTQGAVLR